MKKLLIAAALLLTASTAYAGETYSFDIGGRTVRIHAPNGCDSPSCISVSIPGVYNSGRNNFDDDDSDVRDAPQATAPAKAPAQAAGPSSPAPAAAPPASTPAVAAQPTAAAVAPAPVQQAAVPVIAPAQAATPAPAPAQQASATPNVAAITPAAPLEHAPPSASRPVGPLGMWMTEKKEGRVRIEECGNNLCGYSVDARTNENKEKVLINMKPSGSKWTGKIYDPNSGSTYSSTIAMKGKDGLRVQGCAFGGMFCGGQTWTRTN